MLMRMLEAGGIPVLSDGERVADEDNPHGYWELEAVKRLPTDTAWLADADGRAVKVISALVESLPATRRYRIVFVEREMAEVLASQRRMLERRGERTDRVPDEAMAGMLARHVTALLARIAARPDMRVLRLRHAEVIASPEAAVARLDGFLGGGLDRAAMRAAVDPALHRQRVSA